MWKTSLSTVDFVGSGRFKSEVELQRDYKDPGLRAQKPCDVAGQPILSRFESGLSCG